MKLQTSFYNKAIYINDIKRVGFIGILYFIITFLVTNYGIIFSYTGRLRDLSEMIPNPWDYVMIFFVPVILGTILFRYIQDEKALSTIHAFPVSRRSLFGSHMLTFFTVYGLPILANAVISFFLLLSKGYLVGSIMVHLFIYILGMLVCGGAIFGITVMLGMLVGSSIFQVVLTYVVMVVPIALIELVKVILEWTLKGYGNSWREESLHIIMTPYYIIARMIGDDTLLITGFVVMVIYLVIFILLSYVFYTKRDLERHHDLIVFKYAKFVFVVVMTTLATLVLAAILGPLFSTNSKGSYIGVFFGALIGYGVTKMIAEKTINVLVHYKKWGAVILGALLILFCIDADIIGFEAKVPKTEDIAFVIYSEESYRDYRELMVEMDGYYNSEYRFSLNISDNKGINLIRNLHETVIGNEHNDEGYSYGSGMVLVYILTNGKKVYRTYDNVMTYEMKRDFHESDTYKLSQLKSIRNNWFESYEVEYKLCDNSVKMSKQDLHTFYEAYALDYTRMTYVEEQSNTGFADFTVTTTLPKDKKDKTDSVTKRNYRFPIWPSFEHTKVWLNSHGYEKYVPSKNGVVKAEIYKIDYTVENYDVEYYEAVEKGLYNENIIIEDPALLEEIIEQGYNYSMDSLEEGYLVTLYYKRTEDYLGYTSYQYKVKDVPEWALDMFLEKNIY